MRGVLIKNLFDLELSGMDKGKIYRGKRKPGLILIRDIHCHEEAQMKIAGALEEIHRSTGISKVFIEGAEGRVKTVLYAAFPDFLARKRVAGRFVRSGILSGAEFAAIKMGTEQKLELYGAEDKQLYLQNFIYFRQARRLFIGLSGNLEKCTHVMRGYQHKFYSSDMKTLAGMLEKLNGQDESYGLVLAQMMAFLTQKGKNGGLSNNLKKIQTVFGLEKQWDEKYLQVELRTLTNDLEARLLKGDIKDAIACSMKYRLGKISVFEYLNFLKKTYQNGNRTPNSFEKKYPHLQTWLTVHEYSRSLDLEEAVRTLRKRAEEAMLELAGTDELKNLVSLSLQWTALKKLMALDLSHEEAKNLDSRQILRVFSFFLLNEVASRHELPEKVYCKAMIQLRQSMQFYRLALKRDAILIENALREIKLASGEIFRGVLITGGFHIEGIQNILREKGISYVTWTPHLTGHMGSPYERIMMGQQPGNDHFDFSGKSRAWLPEKAKSAVMLSAPVLLNDILFSLKNGFDRRVFRQRLRILEQMMHASRTSEVFVSINDVLDKWMNSEEKNQDGEKLIEILDRDDLKLLFLSLDPSEVFLNLPALPQEDEIARLAIESVKNAYIQTCPALVRLTEYYFSGRLGDGPLFYRRIDFLEAKERIIEHLTSRNPQSKEAFEPLIWKQYSDNSGALFFRWMDRKFNVVQLSTGLKGKREIEVRRFFDEKLMEWVYETRCRDGKKEIIRESRLVKKKGHYIFEVFDRNREMIVSQLRSKNPQSREAFVPLEIEDETDSAGRLSFYWIDNRNKQIQVVLSSGAIEAGPVKVRRFFDEGLGEWIYETRRKIGDEEIVRQSRLIKKKNYYAFEMFDRHKEEVIKHLLFQGPQIIKAVRPMEWESHTDNTGLVTFSWGTGKKKIKVSLATGSTQAGPAKVRRFFDMEMGAWIYETRRKIGDEEIVRESKLFKKDGYYAFEMFNRYGDKVTKQLRSRNPQDKDSFEQLEWQEEADVRGKIGFTWTDRGYKTVQLSTGTLVKGPVKVKRYYDEKLKEWVYETLRKVDGQEIVRQSRLVKKGDHYVFDAFDRYKEKVIEHLCSKNPHSKDDFEPLEWTQKATNLGILTFDWGSTKGQRERVLLHTGVSGSGDVQVRRFFDEGLGEWLYETRRRSKGKTVAQQSRLVKKKKDYWVFETFRRNEKVKGNASSKASLIEIQEDISNNKFILKWTDGKGNPKEFTVSKSDLEKLVALFGEKGASRILLRFCDGLSPQKMLQQMNRFLFKHITKKAGPSKGGKTPSFSQILDLVTSLGLFQTSQKLELGWVTDEIIRLVYPYLAKDFRFLEFLEEKSKFQEAGSLLSESFREVISFYKELGKFEPLGFQRKVKLKFYQRMGIKFILDKKKVIIADEPGLGKTIQALGAAVNAYNGKGAQKVMIVCPHISKAGVWQKQINKFLRGEQDVFVLKHRSDLTNPKKLEKIKKARFVIVNYELLSGKDKTEDSKKKVKITAQEFREKLKMVGVDFLILDEVHRIRNNNTITYQALTEFHAEYEVGLSGTPLIGKKIGRLFNLLNKFYPDRFPSQAAFVRLYKDDPDLVRQHLKDVMLRRYQQDVLSDLPPLDVEMRIVTLNPLQAKLYRMCEEQIFKELRYNHLHRLDVLRLMALDASFLARVQLQDVETGTWIKPPPTSLKIEIEGISYEMHLANVRNEILKSIKTGELKGNYGELVLKRVQEDGTKEKFQAKNGEVIKIKDREYRVRLEWKDIPSAKYEALDDIVKEAIGEKEKLVVFSGSVKAVERLKKRYMDKGYNPLVIHGLITHSQRKKIIEEFNHSMEPRILIATYHVLGESVDLSTASRGVILDLPWIVQWRDQIIGRLHRMGQKKKVRFTILQAKSTIDEQAAYSVAKGDIIQKMLLDDPRWQLDEEKEIVSRLLAERQSINKDLSEIAESEKGKKTDDAPLTEVLSEKDIFIRFKDHQLTGLLKDTQGNDLHIGSALDLVRHASRLGKKSKDLIRKFFLSRFTSEQETGIRVKNALLWSFVSGVIDGFEDIDYHGKLELMVELSSRILRKIIENPSIDLEGLQLKIEGKHLNDTMMFLDNSNIFKVFSALGIISPLYYLDGKLLQYRQPMQVYYDLAGIHYYDSSVIDAIAPGWKGKAPEFQEGVKDFKKAAASVRKLTPEEEKRLARQLELGNRAAEEALFLSQLKAVMKLSQRVKNMIEIKFSKLRIKVDLDDLEAKAAELLVEILRRYAQNGVYERLSLDEYLKRHLRSKIYALGYALALDQVGLRADESLREKDGESGERTKASMLSQDADQSDRLETEGMFRTLIQFLRIYEFSAEEIRTVLLSLEDEEEEEIAEKLSIRVKEVQKTLQRFQEIMEKIGPKQMAQILAGNINVDQLKDKNLRGGNFSLNFQGRLSGLSGPVSWSGDEGMTFGSEVSGEEYGLSFKVSKLSENIQKLRDEGKDVNEILLNFQAFLRSQAYERLESELRQAFEETRLIILSHKISVAENAGQIIYARYDEMPEPALILGEVLLGFLMREGNEEGLITLIRMEMTRKHKRDFRSSREVMNQSGVSKKEEGNLLHLIAEAEIRIILREDKYKKMDMAEIIIAVARKLRRMKGKQAAVFESNLAGLHGWVFQGVTEHLGRQMKEKETRFRKAAAALKKLKELRKKIISKIRRDKKKLQKMKAVATGTSRGLADVDIFSFSPLEKKVHNRGDFSAALTVVDTAA